MIRFRIQWFVITLLLYGGGASCTQAEREVKDGNPSRAFFDKNAPDGGVRFALYETTDLRLLFCDEPTLKDRIDRSVCVVDGDFRLIMSEQAKAREIQIEKSMSAGELLKKIAMEKWKGGQPQIRLVKRDEIVQSPLMSATAPGKPDVDSFLNQTLEPGDYLIITSISD